MGCTIKVTADFTVTRDADAPQVSVEAQAQMQDAIVVTWNATDAGSGLGTCALEMSADGETWENLSNGCAGTITPVNVLAGQPYTFRVTATVPFPPALCAGASPWHRPPGQVGCAPGMLRCLR